MYRIIFRFLWILPVMSWYSDEMVFKRLRIVGRDKFNPQKEL